MPPSSRAVLAPLGACLLLLAVSAPRPIEGQRPSGPRVAPERRRTLESLVTAQAARGDYRGALVTARALLALTDSLARIDSAQRGMAVPRELAAARRLWEAERRQREAAEQSLAAQQRIWERNALGVLTVLLAVALWVVHRRRTERAALTERLTMTDPLTGVRNRRFVQQVVPADVAGAVRRHRVAPRRGAAPDADLVFFVVDIDHFKRVNDRLGHSAGDRLLENVGKQLSAIVRETDVVARWGGDEFLVISRFTDRDRAAELAERMRSKVAALDTVVAGSGAIRVTCSIGFAAFPFSRTAPESAGWEGVVAIADLAAYAAKRGGRDAWATFRAAQADGVDVVLSEVTLAELDARVAEGRIVMEQSRDGVGAVTT